MVCVFSIYWIYKVVCLLFLLVLNTLKSNIIGLFDVSIGILIDFYEELTSSELIMFIVTL